MRIPKWFWALIGIGVVSFALLFFVFGEQVAQGRARTQYPHIVLITIDTLHVLETGVYNPAIKSTPNLVIILAVYWS